MRFVLLAVSLSLPAFGCGGSSSETPPPLQPDPTSARYTGPRFPTAEEAAAVAQPELDEETFEQPRKPATSTWGSGKPQTTAPKMTSPNALPSALPAAN